MPPRRLKPIETPVTLHVDGEPLSAQQGEPVAVALAASGRIVLGRSVKYHRPRGAACYSGRCDGCLMRVDGLPNVMTCRVAARDGMRIETQNVLGSAQRDVLAAADFFYPRGMDHHEMFTWSKPVNRMMQRAARRIAGIGTLPDEPLPAVAPEQLSPDVLVVGAGPAGLAAATACAEAGLEVCLAEDASAAGGHLGLPGEVDAGRGAEPASAVRERLLERARRAGVEPRVDHTAAGVYHEPGRGSPVHASEQDPLRDLTDEDREHEPAQAQLLVAVSGPERLLRVRPARLIAATGVHEGAAAMPGNDLPGVMGSRAALTLLAHGVLPGERVAVVGEGESARALAAALAEAAGEVVGPLALERVRRVRGRPYVKGIDVAQGDGEEAGVQRERCDVVAVAAPFSAAYETAAQAGARVVWSDGRFLVDASHDDGATRAPWLRAVGECTGVTTLAALLAQARAAGTAIARELAAGRPEVER